MAKFTGQVVQVQGSVVDVAYAEGELPGLFESIEIEREGETPLVLEVQKHLGDNCDGHHRWSPPWRRCSFHWRTDQSARWYGNFRTHFQRLGSTH